jgi:hypothetical protein
LAEQRATAQQRQVIVQRAGGCCEYCKSQARFATQSFSVEHIVPRSQGGKTNLDNLALSCQGCHNHKYNKIEGYDPATGTTVRLYNPRREKWSNHFVWNETFTLIIGIAPTGRATVAVLPLNREGLVNLRRLLHMMGEHPPEEPG